MPKYKCYNENQSQTFFLSINYENRFTDRINGKQFITTFWCYFGLPFLLRNIPGKSHKITCKTSHALIFLYSIIIQFCCSWLHFIRIINNKLLQSI